MGGGGLLDPNFSSKFTPPHTFFSRELLAPGSRSLELFILHPFFI